MALDLPSAGTRWEFVAAAEATGLDDDAVAALERLARLYERAAFAPGPARTADAEWAVEVAAAFERMAP